MLKLYTFVLCFSIFISNCVCFNSSDYDDEVQEIEYFEGKFQEAKEKWSLLLHTDYDNSQNKLVDRLGLFASASLRLYYILCLQDLSKPLNQSLEKIFDAYSNRLKRKDNSLVVNLVFNSTQDMIDGLITYHQNYTVAYFLKFLAESIHQQACVLQIMLSDGVDYSFYHQLKQLFTGFGRSISGTMRLLDTNMFSQNFDYTHLNIITGPLQSAIDSLHQQTHSATEGQKKLISATSSFLDVIMTNIQNNTYHNYVERHLTQVSDIFLNFFENECPGFGFICKANTSILKRTEDFAVHDEFFS